MAVVDLAREPTFALGGVEIRPGTREVVCRAGRQVLEPRVMQVLVVLAQADGEVVTRDDLAATCWDGRVVSEDAINRVISKLRQLADGVAKGAYTIETISKVGYRLVPGEPAVQPEDPKNPPDTERIAEAVKAPVAAWAPSRDERLRFPALLATAALVAAVVVAGSLWLFLPSQPATNTAPPPGIEAHAPSTPSVAVLPLTALETGPNAQLYADGISATISDALSQTELNVIAPAQSFRFRGDSKAGAAGALHADVLVDGDVQRDSERVKVRLRIEDVQSRLILLTQTIERPAARAGDLPDQVATYVAGVLGWDIAVRALRKEPPAPAKLRADLLRAVFQCRSDQNPMCAYQAGQDAIRIAPNNALAQNVFAIETMHALGRLPEAEQPGAVAAARAAALTAIRLDPHFGDPYIALGEAAPDRASTEAYYRRGVESDPTALSVAVFLARGLQEVGREREALPIIQRVAGRFAFMPFIPRTQASIMLQLGHTADAVTILERARRLWPDNTLRVYIDSSVFARLAFAAAAFQGNAAEAEALLRDPWARPMLMPAGASQTLPDIARAMRTRSSGDIQRVSRDCADYDERRWFDTQYCALALTMLGRLNDTFRLAPGETTSDFLFWPQTAPLRADPRFQALTEKLGLFAYWKTTHTRPDFCATEDAPVCEALAQSAASLIKPEAHAAYQRGHSLLAQRNARDMLRAADFLRQAVALEPNYADAHASLALTYNLLFQNGQDKDTLIAAESEAKIALRLDPGNYEANLAHALNAEAMWHWAELKPQMDRLIAQHPNRAEVYHFYGDVLQTAGAGELALAAHRRATALDPGSALYRSASGDTLHLLGRFAEAAAEYRKALHIDPKLAFATAGLCMSLADLGQLTEAGQVLRNDIVPVDGENGAYALQCRLVIAMRQRDADTLKRTIEAAVSENARGAVPTALVAAGYAFAGNFDGAMIWFERAADEKDPFFFPVTNDADLPAALKATPRWAALMRRAEFQELARFRADAISHPPG